ncbi:MAG TPA: 50S ribosomal protein L11 methyltransferase [Thermoanaerobaculia bacterium]|nr:50S ribosomal protein L11 methyltransferase [Thermoanaerobaculia bacterium]
MSYLRRVYLLPAEVEDRLVADLWLAGTLGVRTESVEDGRVRLEAYFAGGNSRASDGLAVGEGGGGEWMAGVEKVSEETLADADWMVVYRATVRAFPVGRSLWVDPREPGEAEGEVPPEGRTLLRLPARMAFGTGSHESTGLVVEILESLELRGLAVLDVGTGTGILCFVALSFGAARPVGCDIDPVAPFNARANSRLNDLYPRLFAGGLGALSACARFDLALVNIVPEQILPELPALVRLVRPGGGVILSGILGERASGVLEQAATLGLFEQGRREAGGWVALHLRSVR